MNASTQNCPVCTRCGRCAPYDAAPICTSGRAARPTLLPRHGCGAAVDIGTTTIVSRLFDLSTGTVLNQTAFYNPQRATAADVMGRIDAARKGQLESLRDTVRTAVRASFGDLPVREAVVTGNTTMLHLFAGRSPAAFAAAPFRADHLFGETIDWDGIAVRLPRCAHALFGADAVAAVRMAGLDSTDDCALLADIGTNGEIALWRGDRRELTVASVAAGPAFERPGLSGSEVVAALAQGLDSGAVDKTGRVNAPLSGGLTQADVSAVQLAKAAVSAGIATLLARTGTRPTDVSRFSLAGGFGSGLDPAAAARIGLFDAALLPVTAVCGNLAVEGATAELFDPSFGKATDRLAETARHIQLGGDAGFSDAFIAALPFA
jgi:uncharacterized 2Fe-2S/4Fe-4S cluster protein (DUF4445 family)